MNAIRKSALAKRVAHDFRPFREELRARGLRDRAVLVKAFFYLSLVAVYALRRLSGARRELHFHPHIPDAEYTVWKMCALLGIKRRPLRGGADIAFAFDVLDHEPGRVMDFAPIVAAGPSRTINLRCTDISKTAVAAAFEEAFGYPIALDPTRHRGPVVDKSDINAMHDGRLIQAPIGERRPGCVYQRLVDSVGPDGLAEYMRVPIVGASVQCVLLKYRLPERRFARESESALLRDWTDVFSREEVACILSLCARLGLDCGELDAARDVADSRLYVMDVNKTCWGPQTGLGLLDGYRVSWRLARAFEANLVSGDGAAS